MDFQRYSPFEWEQSDFESTEDWFQHIGHIVKELVGMKVGGNIEAFMLQLECSKLYLARASILVRPDFEMMSKTFSSKV